MDARDVWSRRALVSLATLVVVACALPDAAAAAAFIRLEGVPENLAFPIPEGRNIIVTATVHGVATESAWLAADAASGLRVMLAPVGEDQYQLNLAADDVSVVVQAAKSRRQFKVFAKTADGKVISSVAIRFSSGRYRVVRPLKIFVTDRVGKRRRELGRYGRNWIDLDDGAAALIVTFAEDAVSTMEAVAKRTSWPCARSDVDGSFELALAADVRDALDRGEVLEVYAGNGPSRRRVCTLAAKPRSLSLPDGSATFTVLQRRSRPVPGSHDYLHLRLGDITGGQVMASLRTTDGATLVGFTSLQKDDEMVFVLGATKYAIKLTQLMNMLFGDDWATFEVRPHAPDVDKLVDALLADLARSGVTFIRNGTPAGSAEAAQHLKNKYVASRAKAKSLEQFIDNFATVSSETGTKYRVRLVDGTTTDAGPWLKKLAAEKKLE